MRRDFRDIHIYALMVVGPGEGARWLDAALAHLATMVDHVILYLDDPDELTLDVVKQRSENPGPEAIATTNYAYRAPGVPTFLEHEGRFRQGAWDLLAECGIRPGDWVFVPDGDEVFVPHYRVVGARHALQASAGFAELNGQTAVSIPIPEVWGAVHETDHPLIRVDGQWAGNAGPRLVAWAPDQTFLDKPMGCGSVPSDFQWSPDHTPATYGVAFGELLHFGYAVREDVDAKWARYSSLADHGHANAHILSIREPPMLVPYAGQVIPQVWRGVRGR